MTKTLNQIFFFFFHQNQNIFSATLGIKKNHNPPPLFKLNGRSLMSIDCSISLYFDCVKGHVIQSHFQQHFGYVIAVSFIDGGNQSIQWKPPTYRKINLWRKKNLNIIYYRQKQTFANKKVEYLHCVQKMKLAMNSTIYFHVIILITKENYTLNLTLEIVLILWNSRKLSYLKISIDL